MCKDSQEPVPALHIYSDQLEVVDSSICLDCMIQYNGSIENISGLASIFQVAASVKEMQRWAAEKGSCVKYVHQCCNTMWLRGVIKRSVFAHLYLWHIINVHFEQRVNNFEIRERFLESTEIETIITECHLRWLGHSLWIDASRLPRRELFLNARSGWKKCCQYWSG